VGQNPSHAHTQTGGRGGNTGERNRKFSAKKKAENSALGKETQGREEKLVSYNDKKKDHRNAWTRVMEKGNSNPDEGSTAPVEKTRSEYGSGKKQGKKGGAGKIKNRQGSRKNQQMIEPDKKKNKKKQQEVNVQYPQGGPRRGKTQRGAQTFPRN